MKLLRLTSQDKYFKTLDFKPGLNIVIGTKSTEQKATDENKETYNGVGKSLSLYLIHYMLGGSIDKCFKKNLYNYKFTLYFAENNNSYKVEREVSQGDVVLNDKPLKIKEYLYFLNDLFLDKEILEKNLTFRGMFSRFARYSRDAYDNPVLQITTKENGFVNNKYNCYLLGLETGFIDIKEKLKKEKERLKILQDNLKDNLNKSDSSYLLDLEDNIKDIEEKLKDFKIAENYNELQYEADKFTQNINDLRLNLFNNKKRIDVKQENIQESPDIKIEVIQRLYEEAKFFLNDYIKKELENVEAFHKTLLANRTKQFKKEIIFLEKENDKINYEIKNLDKERAKIMNILNNSGALEEYNTLNIRLQQLRENRTELKRDESLKKDFKKEDNELRFEIDKLNNQIYNYFITLEGRIKDIQILFRQIIKYFYNSYSGTIEINANDNLTANRVFNIIPKIQGDRSDGINEILIFSYDMLLYELNRNLFGFISHDSRLFDPIDPRQTAKAFEYILEKTTSNGLQYFCSLNKNIFESMINELKNDEIRKQIEESVIIELSESNKLFGFNFDC